MFKHSHHKIAHCADHNRFLIIKRINIWEIPFNAVFLRCCKAWVVYDKYFWWLSFLGVITVFYFIETDTYIKPKGFIYGWRLSVRIECCGLTVSIIMVLAVFILIFIQHKSIFNRTSRINITMPNLGKLWLKSTSSSVLEKYVDFNKDIKLCCHEIVS